jgi:transposase
MTDARALYQTDYATWAKQQAALLRARRFTELDIEHLIDELGDMGKSERRELESRLLILLAHLLKWEYQYRTLSERWREFRGDSWRSTIVEQRKQLGVLLRRAPGLKSALDDTILSTYTDAVDLATKETGLSIETFPSRCPYTRDQVLDDDFYPSLDGHSPKST